ncbi:hypothetical protein BOTBODRAFT_64038 [Botryobasidium botryosum FD-172 SS1]|uniref:Protein ZIP4 homolog n=1 Tax=Botryobasidium botryosum (strain FD-172 SS1) TaxID=930990 RepID=A0A067N1B2_BOTB1|nr:hypothetical protein BOTBODRAFT_64038 [Botryobasidium botryosum FD-172 SS1]
MRADMLTRAPFRALDLLITIKANLSDPTSVHHSSVLEHLHKLCTLCECFTQLRPKLKRNWSSFADTLDREGVSLWNTSTFFRHDEKDTLEDRKLFAALRLAGYRLIEAGLETELSSEALIGVLKLASKAGSALSACGDNVAASNVLRCAASFEESLRNTSSTSDGDEKARAAAVVAYYTGRMEATWKEGNESVAFFMLQQATDEHRLSFLSSHDREHLAAKALEIGKSLFKAPKQGPPTESPLSAKRACDSVNWLQKALQLVEKSNDVEKTPNAVDLKRAILRSLARAYYLSSSLDPSNLTRAEATVDELIGTLDSENRQSREENQKLRWMKLAVLKRKKTGDRGLVEVFRSIIDHLHFSDSEVSDVLQELRLLAETQRSLVTAATQVFLERALDSDSNAGHPFVDRILLSLIFHVKSNPDPNTALDDIEKACASIARHPDFALEKVPTLACQSVLWKYADKLYSGKKWSQAADWYLLAAHQAFKVMAPSSNSKCFRKAALCHIQQGDYSKASSIIRKCPGNEAATQYVVFLAAVHQGLEDESIRAVQAMVSAKDFDRKMLLLATQLAHETRLKPLLLVILESLLKTLRSEVGVETEVEGITLARCMIRIVLERLKEPAADAGALVPTLIRHLNCAKELVETTFTKKGGALIAKDLSWLWRSAYNAAIQGCSEWDNEQVLQLFDIAFELMEAYQRAAVGDADPNMVVYMVLAKFSSLCARVFATRIPPDSSEEERSRLADDLRGFKAIVRDSQVKLHDDAQRERLAQILHYTNVFEAEQLCRLRQWDRLADAIKTISQSTEDAKLETFEAITDILWVEAECPHTVLLAALEEILHSTLNHELLSVEKFSRWMRAICSILLSRNRPSDRLKALGYIEQAVDVLKSTVGSSDRDDVYPQDERQWLLTVSYNTGVECFGASHLDEAKRWFESATVLCGYVNDGKTKATKIADAYKNLLSRYGE